MEDTEATELVQRGIQRHDETESLILMGHDRAEQQDSLITESLIRKFWIGYQRLMDL